MKYLITILFFISFNAKATVYYVATAGSDGAAGTSTGTAWATIAKVNSSSFLPGDQILFNKGDTWNERLLLASSGTAANPIIIGSYGSGANPRITGFQIQGGFTNIGGNVWRAIASNAGDSLRAVLINGQFAHKARYPNTGWSTFIPSGSTKGRIITSVTVTPNCTGFECVVRSSHWVIDVKSIISQSGDTLRFGDSLTYTPNLGGNGYFLQNDSSLVDTLNEYSYNKNTKALIVWSVGSPTVQISNNDTLAWLRSKNYITFDGLSFTGANKAAFQLDTASHITIQNCTINYSGTIAISAKKSVKINILKDSIQNSWSGAIYLREPYPFTPTINKCDSAFIDSNYIKNTGTLSGMGMSNNGRYNGITVIGTGGIVTNNRVDSSGYIGIHNTGLNSITKNNYVNTFCFVKDDGGGIYTVVGAYLDSTYTHGSIIRSNIVLNGIGAGLGTTGGTYAAGIYLDGTVEGVTVDSNTVINCSLAGLFLNDDRTIIVKDNTIIDSLGVCAEINLIPGQLNFKRNILYSQNSTQLVLHMGTDLTSSIDSNYYLRPTAETNKLKYVSTLYSLAGWVSATGHDSHSSSTPAGITTALPLIYFNPTNRDSTFSLRGCYVEAKGNFYTNSVVIAAYQSKILFTSSVPIQGTIGTLKFIYP